MVCRSGEHYKGKWGAPALYALEGVSIGFQLGGQATDFVLLVMNPKGAEFASLQQSEAGSGRLGRRRPEGPHRRGRDRYRHECRDPFLLAQQRPVRRSFAGRLDFALRWQRQRKALRQKADREGNHSRRQGRHSGLRARTRGPARQEVSGEQVGPEVAGVTAVEINISHG